jgi:hypothetical protein
VKVGDEYKFCCLGQIALAYGLTINQIENLATPNCITVDTAEAKAYKDVFYYTDDGTSFPFQAMNLNDMLLLPPNERENLLMALWEATGKHHLTFVN